MEEEIVPGGGFQYEMPFIIGPVSVSCSHDYVLQSDIIHKLLADAGYDEEEIMGFDEDLGPDGDVDSAVFACQQLQYTGYGGKMVSTQEIKEAFADIVHVAENDKVGEAGTMQEISALAKQFGLDFLEPKKGTDRVVVPEYTPPCKMTVQVNHGLLPPRPGYVRKEQGNMVALVLLADGSHDAYRLRSERKWKDAIGHMLPPGTSLGSEAHYDRDMWTSISDTAGESDATSSIPSTVADRRTESRSNSRPAGRFVAAKMTDGSLINIGTHGYRIRKDVVFPVALGDSSLALAELFAAFAGEGMACATGSHSLHQMVSAVLAYGLSRRAEGYDVICEYKGNDISLVSETTAHHVDITSTSGVWHKMETRPGIAAISKYDLANIFVATLPEQPASAFACAIACCLAVEHPAFYGLPDNKGLPEDLLLQYHVSVTLNRMSQRTRTTLAEMSYHALIHEAINDVTGVDIYQQGRGFQEKAQVIIDAIASLPHHERYAFPPVPCGTITGLYDTALDLQLMGLDILLPSKAFTATGSGAVHRPYSMEKFLEEFPASGLAPWAEINEIADTLLTMFMQVDGLTHRGPKSGPLLEGPDAAHWDTVGRIYGCSAVAQFIEVRADVVRCVDSSPVNNPSVWRTSIIYKGKVMLFYRLRDPPGDARGYRIDWFAISTFPVCGGHNLSSDPQKPAYLWPRQRMRSQEMDLVAMAPRKLKLVLHSMVLMARTTRATLSEIAMAWQKLALTAATATWASGANFITCRHLSSSLSAPAPPFDAIAKKLKPAKTFSCILYLRSLDKCLREWTHRDQYHDRCPILGLPRAFSQLEAYWQVWVPDELADTTKHFTDCILGLYDEYSDCQDTMRERMDDIFAQLCLLKGSVIDYDDIRASIRQSCDLKTGGKFGWSVFGSMASAYALSLEGSPKTFDRSFSRGGKARNLASHLTVRHSGRITPGGNMETGTVAEMILKQGVDDYLSVLRPACRFFYGERPYFMNHPKNGEHKDREISITDPDSRIMLNDAEHICGEYGRTTQVDMLKRRDKDALFYKLSSSALLSGGVVQASDASRFAAMMSNIAVGITCSTLAALGGSAHLSSAASVYTRLASRRMIIDTCVMDEIAKRLDQDRPVTELIRLKKAQEWISRMPKAGRHEERDLRYYTTASHTGQGMSHVGMSLEHGGALLMSITAAKHAQIFLDKTRVPVTAVPLVTSDDSTIIASVDTHALESPLQRHDRQRACHIFMMLQRAARRLCLQSVSVMPNLSKEKVSGTAGEFNSQDNGIGTTCPILGFREMICQLTRPCAPSLVTDLLDSHAYGRTVALSGMGLALGGTAQLLKLDAVKQRWKLTDLEVKAIMDTNLLPECLLRGATHEEIITSPASLIPSSRRSALMQLAFDMHQEADTLDVNARDLAFTVLGHVRLSMRKQHRAALGVLRQKIQDLQRAGLPHQAKMLEDSLGATMSSARTRNIGRLAQRVRNQYVSPGPCLGLEFQKAPILESTLSWMDHVASMLRKVKPDEEICKLSAMYGSKTILQSHGRARYPEPATRKRGKASTARKPVFVLSDYGTTPFGKHVVERSAAVVVESMGPEQRRAMAKYMAYKQYRAIPEHTLYGGKLLVSWNRFRSATLGTKAPAADAHTDYDFSTLWGTMCEESIEFLRDVESRDGMVPVLALNYAGGGMAYYHGIHNGKDYSVALPFDRETAVRFDTIPAVSKGGVPVVCALQGWTEDRIWYGTGPTGEEIRAFQNSRDTKFRNIDVERSWLDMEKQSYTHMPLASALVNHGGQDILYAVEPKLTRSCPPPLLPYNKAKYLVSIATGGYWYSAIKGVCVRAYLKGHHGLANSWTGPVLGWRMSKTPDPSYGWDPPENGTVRSLTVVGGIDTDEQISVLNPQEYAYSHCYVDRQGMHMVHEMHILESSADNIALIAKINGGQALFNSTQGPARLIDCAIPPLQIAPSRMDVDECKQLLWERTHRDSFSWSDIFG